MSTQDKTYYVVTHGTQQGIYKNYQKAKKQIYKVKGSKIRKFDNLLEAQIYFKNNKEKNEKDKTYYVVTYGIQPGIYKNYQKAKNQIYKVKGSKIRKFDNLLEAQIYFKNNKEKNKKDKDYYVVTHGIKPGIYKSYHQARNQTYKIKGSKIRKFNNLLDAQIYFKKNKETPIDIYIDGSYNPHTKCYGSGVVIVKNEKIIETLSKKGCKQKYIKYNQVPGELYSCILALNWAKKHNINNINIYYDFEGIYKWITGQYKARINIAQSYKSQVTHLIKNINVTFIKIKSHSGNIYNEMADKIAKSATKNN